MRERERDGGEFRHHLFLGEEAEIAAIGGAGVLGLLLRQFGEVAALLQLFGDRLGLVLGLDQDVAGVNFHFTGDLLGGLLIDLLHGLIGGRGLALGGEQAVHQQAAARERQTLLEVFGILDLLVLGGLGDDFQVDQEGQHIVLLGRRVHLREAGAEFLFCERDVALADLNTVNLGENGVVLGTNRQAGGQNRSQTGRRGQGGKAEAQAGFRFRERGGHGKSLS